MPITWHAASCACAIGSNSPRFLAIVLGTGRHYFGDSYFSDLDKPEVHGDSTRESSHLQWSSQHMGGTDLSDTAELWWRWVYTIMTIPINFVCKIFVLENYFLCNYRTLSFFKVPVDWAPVCMLACTIIIASKTTRYYTVIVLYKTARMWL